MASPSHQNNFDFVRVVAALCVVVSHQFALTGRGEPALLNLHSLGGVGVLIFFSVSGYLVAQSWSADPHPLRFTARRLLRIWPGLAAVVLLAAVVWGPLVSDLRPREYFRHPLFWDYLANLRFSMRDVLPLRLEGNALPLAVNGPLWTIPLELKCYVVLLALGLAGLLRTRWWLAALTAVLVFRYAIYEARGDQLVANWAWRQDQRLLLEFGLFFAAGSLLHLMRIDTRARALALLAFCWLAAGVALWAARPLLALWLVVPSTVIVFGNASTPVIRRAGRFGDLSYGLYIYAFPVQQTWIWLAHGRLSWTELFVLCVATAFVLAFASWHLVEKWALRLKPRRRAEAKAPADEQPAPESEDGPASITLPMHVLPLRRQRPADRPFEREARETR